MWLVLAACSAPPPPPAVAAEPPRPDVWWFVLPDRFADGAPDPPGTVDRADPQAWHGGDLAGLRARLGYLRELGMGGLWLGPVADTRDAPIGGPPDGPWGAFHGYWTVDPGRMEPRFGTFEELAALGDDLHAHGEVLWLDVVWNHVGYGAPATAEHPDWFHRRGDIARWDDPVEVVTHDVHGLPDLAQERPEVAAWLESGARAFVAAARPDGFRVDAVRHLHPGFVARMRERLGVPTLGEIFDGDGGRVAERARAEHLDRVFDFPLYYALTDALCGDRPLGHVPGVLSATLGGALPVTLVDNHDLPRIASRCGGPDGAGLALAVLLGLRGTPALTWGTEHALVGPGEPENRADQPWGAGEGVLAPLLRTLIGFRARHVALREGASVTRWLDDGSWTLWRVHADETVVVAVNRADRDRAVEAPPGPVRAGLRVVGREARASTDPVAPAGGVWFGVYAPVPAPPVREVALTVADAPPGALGWVGATAAFEGWAPPYALPAPDGRLTRALPEGTVLVGKPIVRDAAGVSTYDPGPDRIFVVGEGRGPASGVALAVTWAH